MLIPCPVGLSLYPSSSYPILSVSLSSATSLYSPTSSPLIISPTYKTLVSRTATTNEGLHLSHHLTRVLSVVLSFSTPLPFRCCFPPSFSLYVVCHFWAVSQRTSLYTVGPRPSRPLTDYLPLPHLRMPPLICCASSPPLFFLICVRPGEQLFCSATHAHEIGVSCNPPPLLLVMCVAASPLSGAASVLST